MADSSPSEIQVGAIKKAVEKLSSKKLSERETAQRALDELGASKFDVLLALLRKETASRRKRRRNAAIGIAAYLILLVLVTFVPLFFGHKPHFQFLGQVGSMSGVIAAMFAVSSAQKNATTALADFDDKRTVGWWALALGYDDKSIAAQAREKLLKLLPTLNASDSHLLDAEQRASLYRALVAKSDTITLHKAILKALEQVGDEKAVPFVEKLASGEGPAAKFEELRIAANDCLPALRQRAELARASDSLLRASSTSSLGASPDVLLRAASSPGGVDPSELLRATEPEATNFTHLDIAADRVHSEKEDASVTLTQGA